jgi:hypothetical protein
LPFYRSSNIIVKETPELGPGQCGAFACNKFYYGKLIEARGTLLIPTAPGEIYQDIGINQAFSVLQHNIVD